MKIGADGTQTLITQQTSDHFDEAEDDAERYLRGTLPNGLAFARNGDIIIPTLEPIGSSEWTGMAALR